MASLGRKAIQGLPDHQARQTPCPQNGEDIETQRSEPHTSENTVQDANMQTHRLAGQKAAGVMSETMPVDSTKPVWHLDFGTSLPIEELDHILGDYADLSMPSSFLFPFDEDAWFDSVQGSSTD